MAACSHPERRTLFADPGQFESLASGAYESPLLVAPVVQTTTSAPLGSPLTGGSLVSAALPFDVSAEVNRAPAQERKEDELNSDGSYTELVRGNERFATGIAKGEHRDESRRLSLASGQKPFAVVLSCSDSRVPPELIFDQGLGDLYTIRVAGNVLGSAQVASIEYAVETLGAKLIVVMGHESCGAVKAALSPGKTGSTDQDWLASAIRPNLRGLPLRGIASTDTKIRIPVKANIDAVTDNLIVRSAIIGKAVSGGKLKVVRGIYSLDTGRVDFWSAK